MGKETLETERLILRKFEIKDAEEVFENWTSDDDVSKYVRWATHKNVEETKEYLKYEVEQNKTGKYFSWGIVLKEDNELIGAISAFPNDENKYEVGYNIAKKHWGKGYTTEALKRMLKYLINEQKIYRYKASHAIFNPASGAVMKKAGFRYSHNEIYEKFDKSQKYESKVYYLNIDKINLIEPTKAHEKELIEYKKEHFNNGESKIQACSRWDKTDNYVEWLNLLEKNSSKETVDKTGTVTSQFLGVRESDNKVVGMVNIRHELTTDVLKNYVGHIGYGVRPTERKKGYATQMLEQALKYCKDELKLEKVMIGCYKENIASKKTIINAGGVKEREYITEKGETAQVYWINLGDEKNEIKF